MNINELFNVVKTNPVNGEGSTSKLRFYHGVLYYKSNKAFYPLFAYLGNFFMDFTRVKPSNLGASSRTLNMLATPLGDIPYVWAKNLIRNPVDPDNPFVDMPAIRVTDSRPASDLRIEKPSANTAKMLALGIHPETGKSREEVFNEVGGLTEDDLSAAGGYRAAFLPAMEEQVRHLAHGAITRENTLRNCAQLIGQIKLECDSLSNELVEEMESKAAIHFAPEDFSSAGFAEPHLQKLADKMRRLKKTAKSFAESTRAFEEMALSPDSLIPRVDTESWDGPKWDTRVGEIRPGWSTNIGDFKVGTREKFENSTTFCVGITGVSLQDYNRRSGSYYWVRRNLETYRTVLSQLNFILPNLFGLDTEEWEYTSLAAPLFATQGK